jgi:hypothetical protein
MQRFNLLLIGALVAGVGWSILEVGKGTYAFVFLILALSSWFSFATRSLLRHTRSRLVASFGAETQAKVLRRAIVATGLPVLADRGRWQGMPQRDWFCSSRGRLLPETSAG